MKKLTFKKAHELHVALWGWLAETGKKEKRDWPGWTRGSWYKGIEIPNWCFACHYSDPHIDDIQDCVNCPVSWAEIPEDFDFDVFVPCQELDDSPFRKWENAKTKKTRKKYAAIIAALPWRKK